jgi:hypothetical protein
MKPGDIIRVKQEFRHKWPVEYAGYTMGLVLEELEDTFSLKVLWEQGKASVATRDYLHMFETVGQFSR